MPPPTKIEQAFDLEGLDEPEPENEIPEAPPPENEFSPPPPAMAPAARKRKPGSSTSTTVGMGAHIEVVEGPQKWTHQEADLLWGEVLTYLSTMRPARSPYELSARLLRIEAQAVLLTTCDAAKILGDQQCGPTEALYKWVVDAHMVSARGPQLYHVQFYWKRTGKMFARGSMNLPSPEELHNQRRAEQVQSPPPGLPYYQQPAPPPPPQYAPPQYGNPYGQQGYPPPWQQAAYQPPPERPAPAPASPGQDPQIGQLMAQMAQQAQQAAYMQGALQEALAAAREGRQPNIPPPPAPTPAAPQVFDEERVVRRVVDLLQPLLRPAAPAGVAAPPTPAPAPPPQAASFGDGMQRMMLDTAQQMMRTVMQRMTTQMTEAVTGLGAVPEGEEEEEPSTAIVPAPNPGAMLPFEQIPMEARWADGRPVYYPRSKADGSIDYLGGVMANPFIMEKVADGFGALMQAGAQAIQRMNSQAAPRGPAPQQMAQQATVTVAPAGVGAPPPQPAPTQAPPPPQAEPPAPAVPAAAGGWPDA